MDPTVVRGLGMARMGRQPTDRRSGAAFILAGPARRTAQRAVWGGRASRRLGARDDIGKARATLATSRRGATRRRLAKLCPSVPVRTRKTRKSWIEVHKVLNRKVVDLTTLYNFHKGRIVFFSMDFAQFEAKLWMSPCFGEQEVLTVDQVFNQFPLKIWNANLHESCVPRQTGQLPYCKIFKCFGEIWRTRQKFRKTFADVSV
jgi:hypothetical protein